MLEQHRRDMLAVDSDRTAAIALEGNPSAVESEHNRLAIWSRPRAGNAGRDPGSACCHLQLTHTIAKTEEFTLLDRCYAKLTE